MCVHCSMFCCNLQCSFPSNLLLKPYKQLRRNVFRLRNINERTVFLFVTLCGLPSTRRQQDPPKGQCRFHFVNNLVHGNLRSHGRDTPKRHKLTSATSSAGSVDNSTIRWLNSNFWQFFPSSSYPEFRFVKWR
jgi:hypothetical protein